MPRLSLAALAFAGMIALAACGEDTENENDSADAEDTNDQSPAEEEDDGDGGANADETIAVEAGDEGGDLYFEGIPDTIPAGVIQFDFENVGEMDHDIVIEELDNEEVVDAEGGETDSETIELEPGEYTFYCSVSDHREQGMEQTVTVE